MLFRSIFIFDTRNKVIVIKYNNNFVTCVKDKYVGASCKAMYELGKKKGYTLVCILADNMFFVKNNLADKIPYDREFFDSYLDLYSCEKRKHATKLINDNRLWIDLGHI